MIYERHGDDTAREARERRERLAERDHEEQVHDGDACDCKSPALTHNDCIEGPDTCTGRVEYRMSLSGTGQSYPRCDGHWEQRLDREERLRQDYPDSSTPPAWFDPLNAGETWDYDY